MKNLVKYFLLYFTPLVYWGFYDYVGLPEARVKLVIFIYTLFLFIILSPTIFSKRYNTKSYSWYVKGIILIILISMFMPSVFWNQSLVLTYRVTAYHFAFLYYFLLLKYNITEKEITKVVVFYGIVYALLFSIAWIYAPIPIFTENEEIRADRGTFRIIISSFDIILLLYFLLINNLKNRKRSWLSALLLVPCVFFIISNLTRSIWVAVILVTLYAIFSNAKVGTVVISGLVVLILFPLWSSSLSKFASNNEILSNVLEMTETQLNDLYDLNEESGETRLIEYRIGFTEFKRNAVTFVLGSGRSHPFSDFGRYEDYLKTTFKFHRSDAGYPSIFVTYGLVGLLLFLGLFIKVLRDKNDRTSPYKMYLIVIIAINFLQDATTWYAIATSIALYMMEKQRRNSLPQPKAIMKYNRAE